MYRINRQITLMEFASPFGQLNKDNRWVKIADIIPWDKYEQKYAALFCEDNGAPAVSFRMALGTLLIKQMTGYSDAEVVADILENPYKQYLIGLHEFTEEPPFSVRSITNFRKYISQEMLDEINEALFRPKPPNPNDPDNHDGPNQNPPQDDAPPPHDPPAPKPSNPPAQLKNKGEILLDATCTPAYIAFPTDLGLLNRARKLLEEIIDELHRFTKDKLKPRTYREEANKKFLAFIKNRKPRKNTIRKAKGQQLRYVRRNLRHIDKQLQQVPIAVLSNRLQGQLATIRVLYEQQLMMYQTQTTSAPERIVSIAQPHVRPIVRGKARVAVEFGAKVSISMIDGFAFVDKTDWNAYSEASLLISIVEAYKEKHGCYPEAVIADKLYRNRANLRYCKEHGIRLSGPRLGRPPKQLDKAIQQQERRDAATRNAVEGKFGEGKTRYGLDRIMARLKETAETIISMAFLCMNISRRLRLLLCLFWMYGKISIVHVDNSPKAPLFCDEGVFS